MPWWDAPWLKEVAAIAMAGLLLWRFERMAKQQACAAEKMAKQQAEAADRARADFLAAYQQQRVASQEFEANHMAENRRAIEAATATLAQLCERQEAVETRVSDCPHRGKRT